MKAKRRKYPRVRFALTQGQLKTLAPILRQANADYPNRFCVIAQVWLGPMHPYRTAKVTAKLVGDSGFRKVKKVLREVGAIR